MFYIRVYSIYLGSKEAVKCKGTYDIPSKPKWIRIHLLGKEQKEEYADALNDRIKDYLSIGIVKRIYPYEIRVEFILAKLTACKKREVNIHIVYRRRTLEQKQNHLMYLTLKKPSKPGAIHGKSH